MKIEIVSMARSGSTYLYDALTQATNSVGLCEPFNPNKKNINISNIVDQVNSTEKIVLKTHINHRNKYVTDNNDYESIEWFRILLLRKNIFECTLSHTIAEQINNYNSPEIIEKININQELFLTYLKLKIECWNLFYEFKKNKNYNVICYFEDFSFDWPTDLSFLNISTTQNVYNKKIEKFKIINNYNEILDLFYSTINTFKLKGVNFNNGSMSFND